MPVCPLGYWSFAFQLLERCSSLFGHSFHDLQMLSPQFADSVLTLLMTFCWLAFAVMKNLIFSVAKFFFSFCCLILSHAQEVTPRKFQILHKECIWILFYSFPFPFKSLSYLGLLLVYDASKLYAWLLAPRGLFGPHLLKVASLLSTLS